jgi:hypothetical protein
VVNVFSPVAVFTPVNGVTITHAGVICQILTADIRNCRAAAIYRYFNWFSQF